MTGIYDRIWYDLPQMPKTEERYAYAQQLWDKHQFLALEAVANLAGAFAWQYAASRPANAPAVTTLAPELPPDIVFDKLGDRDHHLELARLSWNHLTGRMTAAQMGVEDPTLPAEGGDFLKYGADGVFWFHYWIVWAVRLLCIDVSDEEYERRVDEVLDAFDVT